MCAGLTCASVCMYKSFLSYLSMNEKSGSLNVYTTRLFVIYVYKGFVIIADCADVTSITLNIASCRRHYARTFRRT
jgi:hypothetical protein